jgi:hypothetical protein
MTVKKTTQPRKITKFSVLLGMMIVVLIGVQIWLSNRLATEGQTLSKLQEEAQALNEGNRILKGKLAEKISLSKLSDVAVNFGFVTGPEVLSFPADPAVAYQLQNP